jgi:hypothetical protein
MRRLLVLVLGLALGLVALPSGSFAETSAVLARVVESGKLRVGMSGDQPPLNFKTNTGEFAGFEVDMARGMAGLMGVELEIVQKPFGELLGALESGKVDMVLSGMTITAQRNLRVAFIGPYYLSGKSILTKSAALAGLSSPADLNRAEVKLATLKGSTSQDFVEMLLPEATLVGSGDRAADRRPEPGQGAGGPEGNADRRADRDGRPAGRRPPAQLPPEHHGGPGIERDARSGAGALARERPVGLPAALSQRPGSAPGSGQCCWPDGCSETRRASSTAG